MDPLEIALVILVSIWSVIFVVLGIVGIFLMLELKKSLEKFNHILENAEQISENVGESVKAAASGIAALTGKSLIDRFIDKTVKRKKRT